MGKEDRMDPPFLFCYFQDSNLNGGERHKSTESRAFKKCAFQNVFRIHSYLKTFTYRIVASTSPSRIEAHAGLFRSLMKGIFDPYVL